MSRKDFIAGYMAGCKKTAGFDSVIDEYIEYVDKNLTHSITPEGEFELRFFANWMDLVKGAGRKAEGKLASSKTAGPAIGLVIDSLVDALRCLDSFKAAVESLPTQPNMQDFDYGKENVELALDIARKL